jgi:RNA polymerase-binding transcription factor DksA
VPKHEHRISNVDEEARRGDCAKCGAGVPVRRRSTDPERPGWRCRPPESGSRQGAGAKKRSRRKWEIGRYGLTVEEYERVNNEDAVCALCGAPKPEARRHSADHCHKTGKFRGVLCHRCNTGLGLFGDDPDLLDKAAAYLRAHAEG